MDNHKTKNYNSYYLIPALICGILTSWIVTGSVVYTIVGAVLGLLTAAFWINVVADKGEEA